MNKKVININQKREYEKRILKTQELLTKVEQNLFNEIIDLATIGKWKKWSDEQEIGTVFNFTDEMLKETGDKNIDALYELMDELIRIRKKITNIKQRRLTAAMRQAGNPSSVDR